MEKALLLKCRSKTENESIHRILQANWYISHHINKIIYIQISTSSFFLSFSLFCYATFFFSLSFYLALSFPFLSILLFHFSSLSLSLFCSFTFLVSIFLFQFPFSLTCSFTFFFFLSLSFSLFFLSLSKLQVFFFFFSFFFPMQLCFFGLLNIISHKSTIGNALSVVVIIIVSRDIPLGGGR